MFKSVCYFFEMPKPNKVNWESLESAIDKAEFDFAQESVLSVAVVNLDGKCLFYKNKVRPESVWITELAQ